MNTTQEHTCLDCGQSFACHGEVAGHFGGDAAKHWHLWCPACDDGYTSERARLESADQADLRSYDLAHTGDPDHMTPWDYDLWHAARQAQGVEPE